MNRSVHSLILSLALTVGGAVHAQSEAFQILDVDTREAPAPSLLLSERDLSGLPGLRPRLTMSIPLASEAAIGEPDAGMFSWSLEAWRLNTASLAHIHCNRLTPTIDSYLAEDCRFVDQPVPENAVNLVQVRGQWTAAPGLSFGVGAFSSRPEVEPSGSVRSPPWDPMAPLRLSQDRPTEGVDANLSFGIAHDRVGEFLVGLQVARYRQRMSLLDFGFGEQELAGLSGGSDQLYANSAQLALGWRRGSLSGDLVGHSREVPLYLGPGRYAQTALSSFDLELSWRAVRNASISIGVSNVLDAAPRGAEDSALEAGMDDPLEHVFGRIPYVRYKHDL
ncbi:MAG: hypothetical protein EA419_01780 [Wenzhouxiangella sp.]|nr:MAG: hypothetical protein EA419_01780 [Wenzhouxiangella sp.]